MRAANKTEMEIFGEAEEALHQLARMVVINYGNAGNSMHASRLLSDAFFQIFQKPVSGCRWKDGREFYWKIRAKMRDCKIDYLRKKNTEIRGCGKVRSLDVSAEEYQERNGPPVKLESELITAADINRALLRLHSLNPEQADIVVLGAEGYTYDEIADRLNLDSGALKYQFTNGTRYGTTLQQNHPIVTNTRHPACIHLRTTLPEMVFAEFLNPLDSH